MSDMTKRVTLALLAMQRHSWEQGVAMQAFLESGEQDMVVAMALEAASRSLPDGRTATLGVFDGVTDPCSTGEALWAAAAWTGEDALRTAADRLLAWAMSGAPRTAGGVVYHLIDKPELWVDSLYMLPPFLAAAGQPQEALRQLWGLHDALRREDGLLGHRWDDAQQTWIRRAAWGVGNGWALAGMARVAGWLPPALAAEKRRVTDAATALIEALLPHLRADALFHDVVDDPSTFVETNLSQMLAYTLLRGMHDGWLEAARYAGLAARLRQAARAQVDAYGLVRGVCGAPTFDKPGVAPEGQAFFLLMESAWTRWEAARVQDGREGGATT